MSLPAHQSNLPHSPHSVVHLAVIMDGNGRWATGKGLSRSEGHRAGTRAAKTLVEECVRLGIRHLTLYTFSQENWNRPAEEISCLFSLLVEFITQELPLLEQKNIKLHVLGKKDKLPYAARKTLEHAMERTADNTAMVLNLALNYSGREEIVEACKAYAASGASMNGLTIESLAQYLYTAGQPDPDLVIRTSGEQRTSNFLPFQSVYSELYFTDVLWPDFAPADLHKALEEFTRRNRRFGGLTTSQGVFTLK